ncbi:alpha/beta-hydrolase [Vararia minispora EC-137]|uniref:Alpha/beta-hydrolase n=1 Tax=Vararia minispora EC-137 TaxID=1314806 RepID=A0ACB8Q5E8_9AGAM|nr:alpha/beta-hydrolase [Vararia minispora EC-137]
MSPSESIVKLVTSSDGSQIYADSVGDPKSHIHIVFLHGLGLSGAVFDHIFANTRYSSQFYMVRYDLRGSGRSTKPDTPEAYTPQKIADDYRAVESAFNLKKAFLVGWCVLPHTGTGNTLSGKLSGAVYLAGLPYIGPIMADIGTPTVHGFMAGILSSDNVALAMQTRVAFVDSLFSKDPESVPYQLKCVWVGMSISIPPAVNQSFLSRTQDPSSLFALAKTGFPLLIVHGKADTQIMHDKLIEHLKPHFTNMTVHLFDGLGHALFYEDVDVVMGSIETFVRDITTGRQPGAG